MTPPPLCLGLLPEEPSLFYLVKRIPFLLICEFPDFDRPCVKPRDDLGPILVKRDAADRRAGIRRADLVQGC